MIINFSAGVMTAIVVAVFATVKFTEGAWVVVILFIILVPALIRLNREYSEEGEVLETISENQPPPPPNYPRRTVFVFVDGLTWPRSRGCGTRGAFGRPASARCTSSSTASGPTTSGEVDPGRPGGDARFHRLSDRRLTRAAMELVEREINDPGTHVTVVLPGGPTRHCSGGCCTTARRTRSPRW